MISRAASRTSSEAPAPFSVPSITAFSFSRVRSDAGILSIGVLLSQRPAQYRSTLIANQATVHPNPLPSKLRTSPGERIMHKKMLDKCNDLKQACCHILRQKLTLWTKDLKKRRQLSTLAALRDLRARASDPAWTRRAVDEGVKSCPRAQCGKSARCVRSVDWICLIVRHREKGY